MSTNMHTAWSDSTTTFAAASMNPALAALDLAISNGLKLKGIVALADTAVTLTAAQIYTSGILTAVPSTARNQQLPTAASIIAALPAATVGFCFDFCLVVTAAYDETLTTNTGLTLTGNMVVNNSSGRFCAIVTSGSAVTVLRIG